MNRKKFALLALSLALLTSVAAGCSSEAAPSSSAPAAPAAASSAAPSAEPATAPASEEEDKIVTLWGEGSDNVNQQFIKQVEVFNANNPDGYTVEIQWVTSGTGAQGIRDRIVAAKLAGETNTDFDLIELGEDSIIQQLAAGGEDLYTVLDKSKIPNIADLKVSATFRDDLLVPYRGTTVVLAYNSEVVTEPPQTSEELIQWIKDHPGRFAYNTPDSGGAGGAFVNTAIYNLMPEEAILSSDAKWMEEWDKGFDLLKEIHPFLYQSGGKVIYPNKNQGTLDLLANKEVDMIPTWADMAISQTRQGLLPESTKISQITPAFTGNTVAFGIPTIGSSPEGAYQFINYMLSPEAQNIALDTMAAIPVIDFAKLDESLLPFISSLKIDKFRISGTGALSTDMNERWTAEISVLG